MTIRRVFRILLKLATCVVGGVVAALVFILVVIIFLWASEGFSSEGPKDLDEDDVVACIVGGVAIGLFAGISWAIEHQEARKRFIVSPIIGVVLGGCIAAFLQFIAPLVIGILLGLFIGTVSALATVGVFKDK